jgi:hypothetical protein
MLCANYAMSTRATGGLSGVKPGAVHLFFGCRWAEADYLYSEEWQQLKNEGILTGLHVAFSRDGPEKHYVTHLIREQAESIWSLLQQVCNFLSLGCWMAYWLAAYETVAYSSSLATAWFLLLNKQH